MENYKITPIMRYTENQSQNMYQNQIQIHNSQKTISTEGKHQNQAQKRSTTPIQMEKSKTKTRNSEDQELQQLQSRWKNRKQRQRKTKVEENGKRRIELNSKLRANDGEESDLLSSELGFVGKEEGGVWF